MSAGSRLVLAAAVAAHIALAAPAAAQPRTIVTQTTTLAVTTVAGPLEHPWGLAVLPDGGFLVTERPGRLRRVAPNGALSPPLAGVPEVAAYGQGGLLDVALAPDFATSGTIFLSYAEPGPGGASTALARARLDGGRLTDLRVLFRQSPKSGGTQHFGNRIVPARDGAILLALGDRGRPEQAQSLATHIAKVVRVSPSGAALDNPYRGVPGALPEIFSVGHRNVQGAALHPATGELWTAEHGARGGDEINRVLPGRNYGWPVITYGRDYSGASIGVGTHQDGMEQPIHYWDPSIAPSGLAFYTSDRLPGWRGGLLVGALRGQALHRLTLDGGRVTAEERIPLGVRVRHVVAAPDGTVLILSDEADGAVLRLDRAG